MNLLVSNARLRDRDQLVTQQVAGRLDGDAGTGNLATAEADSPESREDYLDG